MEKTDRQTVLELQHGQPIQEIIEQTLEKHRGKRHYATLATLELGRAGATLYKWADSRGIDIADYRKRKTLAGAGHTGKTARERPEELEARRTLVLAPLSVGGPRVARGDPPPATIIPLGDQGPNVRAKLKPAA